MSDDQSPWDESETRTLRERVEERTASWTNRDRYALAAVTAVAGILRIVRVGSPGGIMFDETYYAKDSCWYLLADPNICEIDTEQPQVHPPLAKWVMAIGIRIFGFDSVGWRIASVIFGTLTVVLLYLVARKLLKSTLAATIASGLLAIDFLHFVQSRIAMLDIFVPAFGMAAILFVLYDRDRMLARLDAPDRPPTYGLLDRPWRLWAGVAAACALASKWSGGLYLATVIVLTIAWEFSIRRRDGRGHPLRRLFLEETTSIAMWLVVVPILVYAVTYIGRIDGTLFAWPWSEGSWIGAFMDHQRYMADFHRGLIADHTYQSPPWSWMLIKRPVSYAFSTDPDGRYREVFATGSPFVWWAAILAIGYAAYRWVKNRNLENPEGTILAGVALLYGPWLLPQFADRRAIFLFYLLPVVPFMCLALAYVASRVARFKKGRIAIAVYSSIAVALFAFYYPLLANVAISQPKWDQRIWIFDNCDKPPPHPATTQITSTNPRNEVIVTSSVYETDADLPPKGWCWI